LRMPSQQSELPPGDTPGSGEDPFHCVLEDDRLVTALNITTDRLLRAPAGKGTDVLLVIKVEPRLTAAKWGNISFA
jgi:hypothetical protein